MLGYDGELSRGHNFFCPRVIIFVPDERFGVVGESLRNALIEAAPPSYLGFPLTNLVTENALHLLNFVWGPVLVALRQQIPPDLRTLPALVTPVTF